jgi:hypothetical protein
MAFFFNQNLKNKRKLKNHDRRKNGKSNSAEKRKGDN